MLFVPLSDAAIVRQTLEGRPEAFEPLVFRYQRKALALARAAGLGPEAADDVVQEAFLQAFRDLPCLRDPVRFGAWFLSIVRNVARKVLERRPPACLGLAHDHPAQPAGEPVESKEFSEYLWRKVSELPEGIREAIFLYYHEGRKVREVARALSITSWGVKRRLRSGRDLLRGRLWRALEQCLRDMLPSAREWRKRGGRLGLLVLASVPISWASRAGAALSTPRREAPWTGLVRAGEITAGPRTAVALLALGLLAIVLGGASWVTLHPARRAGDQARFAARSIPEAPRRAGPATQEERPPEAPAGAEPRSGEEARPSTAAPDPEDVEYERSLGSVLVRAVWGDDHTPAGGIHGMVVPWGSPALYIDEREFCTGPDGIVRVDRIHKGGVSVMLDRGGRADVPVLAGEESEATVEVPRGLDVEGVVVERSGSPAGGALVWISYGGHTNWGNEVARTGADGAFFLRSVQSGSFIAARAPGRAPSLIRGLQGEAGSRLQVRIVLPGSGGAISGSVHDPGGNPVPHAKVMVGPEFPGLKTLEDGAGGLSAPPYLVFTDAEGLFHADSLAPGETRVAVRARGFAPLEGAVQVEPGARAEVELVLSRGAILAGVVTGANGQPASGTRIVTGDWNQLLAVKVFSSPDGSYRLRGLPPGEVEVFAERDGWGKASTRLAVKDRETLRWDPVLSRELEVLGRVVDETGAGHEGFLVVLEEMLGAGGRRFRSERKEKTGAGGRFRLADASDIAYRLIVYEPESAFPSGCVEEVRPGPGELVVRIGRDSLSSARLLGRVLDAAGVPVGGAKVFCFGQVAGLRVYLTEGEGGRFEAGPLPPGRYRLEVQAPGYPPLGGEEKEVSPREVLDLGTFWLK